MARIVEISKPYRYFDRKRHRVKIIQPGTYKIPEEIPNDVAEKAYFVGIGRITIVVPPLKAEVHKESDVVPLSDGYVAPPAKRKRGRPRKSLGVAPENK